MEKLSDGPSQCRSLHCGEDGSDQDLTDCGSKIDTSASCDGRASTRIDRPSGGMGRCYPPGMRRQILKAPLPRAVGILHHCGHRRGEIVLAALIDMVREEARIPVQHHQSAPDPNAGRQCGNSAATPVGACKPSICEPNWRRSKPKCPLVARCGATRLPRSPSSSGPCRSIVLVTGLTRCGHC